MAKLKSLSQTHFVALDGEAVNIEQPDGSVKHTYVLLCSSDGKKIYNPKGLTTIQCFDFLLAQKENHPKSIFAGFSFNYDINMILLSLRDNSVEKLWHEKYLRWYRSGRGFFMEWAPGKTFTLKDLESGTALRINDVFGFYQCSFVKALEAWKIGAPETITRMKAERHNFTLKEIDEITAYCFEECRLLVELLTHLDAALMAANLRPNQWCGAGSIAATLLQREGVKAYKQDETKLPAEIQTALLHAYFGGRVEVFQMGEFQNVHAYDIRSAYPAVAANLPDSRGEWRQSSIYSADDFGIWHVSWSIPNGEAVVCPFPFRQKGKILYPSSGEGFYWHGEVSAALALYPRYITVHGGYTFHPETDVKPFSFIPQVYAERAEAKRNGHAKEKVLKLGLNATYGKLAQGYGYRGRVPAFRSFLWAGIITSETRAKLVRFATAYPESIISFATDGVLTTGRHPTVTPIDVLGGWEYSELQSLFVAQPGVYTGVKADGKEILKSRGFFSKELDFAQIIEGYRSLGTDYVYTSEKDRFFGIGTAVAWRNIEIRGTWRRVERKLKLTPSRKFPPDPRDKPKNPLRLRPPIVFPGLVSEKYKPKSTGLDIQDDAALTYIQGLEQPEIMLEQS